MGAKIWLLTAESTRAAAFPGYWAFGMTNEQGSRPKE